MAAAFTFGAAMTLRAGGHIRVNLVLARVTPATRRWMETVRRRWACCFAAYLTYAMGDFTWRASRRGQVSLSSDDAALDPPGAGDLRHAAC